MTIKTKLSGIAMILVAQQASAGVALPITAFDQYTLELVNSMRANPQAAANTYLSGNLNEGLAVGTISATAKQPLAWDLSLVASAESHTTDMINNNYFDHIGSDGTNPFTRMTNAGYIWQAAGENIATRGQTGLTQVTADITQQMNTDLFVDFTEPSRGHRTNMLSDGFEAVGISVGFSPSYSFLGNLPSDLVTLDFGSSALGAYLTGVAYNDTDHNNFYTPGEGLSGLTVTAFLAGTSTIKSSTVTLAAGGYSLDLGAGNYDLQIIGALGRMFVPNISLGSSNLKFDYTNTSITAVPVPAAVWLFASGLLVFSGRSKRHDKK